MDRSSLPVCTGAICYDSRRVRAGDVFVCVPGFKSDGHKFAAQAVEAGAIAVVASRDRLASIPELRAPIVGVRSPRRSLSALAAAHEGFPARGLVTIGVTGTDGKTTTTHVLASILRSAGYRVGLVSTVAWEIDGHRVDRPCRLTTPESPELHSILAKMAQAGCTHAVIECSSHGIALGRVSDCDFDGAILTSLSSDHLDFHKGRQAYIDAKLRLFRHVGKLKDGWGVVGRESDMSARFLQAAGGRGLTFGVCVPGADVEARCLRNTVWGTVFELRHGAVTREIEMQLPGVFNVGNALAAYCASQLMGIDGANSAESISQFSGVHGRMQIIPGAPFQVIVDYAHTRDAMAMAIGAIRERIAGRLIVVFGCAGDRSKERRTGVSSVIARHADFAIVTDDDPRSEGSTAVIDDVVRGLRQAGAKEYISFERCPDREVAIDRALSMASRGDAVLLAGKGHEPTIEYADRQEPWNEVEVVQRLLAMRFGKQIMS